MADFEPAIEITLRNEGGYVNDPLDPGGETNFGISKRSYPDVDIKNLTVDDAKAIYQRDFWKFNGILDQAVANKVFDMYVNMGRNAIKILQHVVGVVVDGIYGPETEELVNTLPNLLPEYKDMLAQYYKDLVAKNPNKAKFLNGWLKRAAQ